MLPQFAELGGLVLLVGVAPVQLGKLEMLQPFSQRARVDLRYQNVDNRQPHARTAQGLRLLAIDAAYGPAG